MQSYQAVRYEYVFSPTIFKTQFYSPGEPLCMKLHIPWPYQKQINQEAPSTCNFTHNLFKAGSELKVPSGIVLILFLVRYSFSNLGIPVNMLAFRLPILLSDRSLIK